MSLLYVVSELCAVPPAKPLCTRIIQWTRCTQAMTSAHPKHAVDAHSAEFWSVARTLGMLGSRPSHLDARGEAHDDKHPIVRAPESPSLGVRRFLEVALSDQQTRALVVRGKWQTRGMWGYFTWSRPVKDCSMGSYRSQGDRVTLI